MTEIHPVSKEQTIADLRGARAAIVEHGWTQGTLIRRGKLCSVGGILAVCGMDAKQSDFTGIDWSRVRAARQAISDCVGCGELVPGDTFDGVPEWNDQKDRTVDDVLNAFEKAAIQLEERV